MTATGLVLEQFCNHAAPLGMKIWEEMEEIEVIGARGETELALEDGEEGLPCWTVTGLVPERFCNHATPREMTIPGEMEEIEVVEARVVDAVETV